MSGLPIHLASICLKHFASQPDSQLIAMPYYGFGVTTFQIRQQQEG
jgi:hypothetical protein